MIKRLVTLHRARKRSNKDNRLSGNPTIIPRHEHAVSRSDISDNAIKVLKRLNYSGYQAYLVGGSVRDLILRKAPKDFDIATDAKPEQICKLFRNSRLIGKRFRLAHIQFGREIIEVATFRCEGNQDNQHRVISDEGMILRDNVYGSMEDDAKRRDFTLNALYYDISNFSIVDYTHGYEDIKNHVLRIIGDPEKRYLEDPVRMLRAIRFQSKHDFTLDPDTAKPIKALAERLQQVPAARLFEEVLKILQHGRSLKNYESLQEYGLFRYLFPIVFDYCQQQNPEQCEALILATLKNTDERIAKNRPVTPAFLFAAILWFPLLELVKEFKDDGLAPLRALERGMDAIIHRQNKTTTIPKRFLNVVREIWLLQYRLPRRYGKKAFRVLQHPRFRAGYDFLLLRAEIGDEDKKLAQWWTDFQQANEENQQKMIRKLNNRNQRQRKKPNASD